MLKRTSGLPLFHQLKQILEEQIETMSFGDKLESESQMIARYGVSRGTVRQAIVELEKEGLVYRLQGKGTFKGGVKIRNSNCFARSFTEEIISSGLDPGLKNVVLEKVALGKTAADLLDIPTGSPAWELSRVRTANGIAVAFATAYIPVDVVENLQTDSLEMSLIVMIEEKLGIQIYKTETSCMACLSEKIHCEKLDIGKKTPLLRMEHVVFDNTLKKICLDITYSVSDKYILRFSQITR